MEAPGSGSGTTQARTPTTTVAVSASRTGTFTAAPVRRGAPRRGGGAGERSPVHRAVRSRQQVGRDTPGPLLLRPHPDQEPLAQRLPADPELGRRPRPARAPTSAGRPPPTRPASGAAPRRRGGRARPAPNRRRGRPGTRPTPGRGTDLAFSTAVLACSYAGPAPARADAGRGVRTGPAPMPTLQRSSRTSRRATSTTRPGSSVTPCTSSPAVRSHARTHRSAYAGPPSTASTSSTRSGPVLLPRWSAVTTSTSIASESSRPDVVGPRSRLTACIERVKHHGLRGAFERTASAAISAGRWSEPGSP